MRTRTASTALLAIVLITISSLLVGTPLHLAQGQLGLVKAYGPGFGTVQPYEPAGPWIDGIEIPQFLSNQNNEWSALKDGTIDLYDWPLRPSQIAEYNSNPCVTAPDAPAGIAPCRPGLAPIQHEISLLPVQAFNKFQLDMQNRAFPTNLLAFRQAVAYATDKEKFITNSLNGLGAPNYAPVGCPALCGPGADGVFNTTDDLWIAASLNENGLSCISYAGTPMPYGCNADLGKGPYGLGCDRYCTANNILDATGFPVGQYGFRVDSAIGCSSRTLPNGQGFLITVNDCGRVLQPVFYSNCDNPDLLALNRQLQAALQNGLHIDMDIGGSAKYTGDFQNYIELPRRPCFPPSVIFNNFAYNLFSNSWSLGRDPTYIDDLYDSRFIKPGSTNYPNYNDPIFDNYARGLRNAQAGPERDPFANARALAYAAETEFNATVPVVDIWTDTAPHALRVFHKDTDPVLNGLRWEGFQNQVGVGPHNSFSWLNVHLVGAPLHDPNHPVFMRWGFKIDVLDSPNPVDSSLLWDTFADSLTYDNLNSLATDDAAFSGDLPWTASLPALTIVTAGSLFPNGEVCSPDDPASACSVLSYRLRPDLTFAASLDGTTPSISVTANDIRFSILDSRSSPTSFIAPNYKHVQDVVVKSSTSFDVYERTSAIWDRHNIGSTPILSVQHWCQEAHDAWAGGTLASCLADPGTTGYTSAGGVVGWPDFGVSVLSSTNGHQTPGSPLRVDLGSNAFVFDSQLSFTLPPCFYCSGGSPGPIIYRARETPGLSLPSPYTRRAPSDAYFTNVLGANSGGVSIGGWHKFHLAGNINWYCTATTPQACSAGITAETGPLPAPDMVINVVDLAIVAVHFGETPGLTGFPYSNAAWDLSGPSGVPDGTVNIFDLSRVAQHFGQSYLGGTDLGGGTVGTLPGWIYESMLGT